MRIIHVVSSRSWDDQAERALRAALAMRSIGFAQNIIVTDKATQLHTHYAAHRLDTYPMNLHGFSSLFTPARLGNMLRNEPGALLHLHDSELVRIGAGALSIARPNGARMLLNASKDEIEQLDPRRKALISADDIVACTLPEVGFNIFDCTETTDLSIPLRILVIGELTKESGISEVVDSLLAFPDPTRLRLTVVGSGKGNYIMPILRKLRKAKLDEQVEWLGDSIVDEKLWTSHDLLLLPSSKSDDGELLAPLAMAHGLALIALDTPAHRSSAMGSALLYTATGPQTLATSLKMLLDDPELLIGMKHQNCEIMRSRPTPDEFAGSLRAFYTRIMQ